MDSVRKLTRALERALMCGHGDIKSMIDRIIQISLGNAEEYDIDESVRAFQWLADHDGGLLNDALRKAAWRNPSIIVNAVRAMRAFASDPTVSPKKRAEARRALKEHGFDDESLRDLEP